MLKGISLRGKIILLVLAVTIADIFTEIVVTINKQDKIVENKYREELKIVQNVEKHNINSSIEHVSMALHALSPAMNLLLKGDSTVFKYELSHYLKELPISNIVVLDSNLNTIRSLHPEDLPIKKY